MYQEIYESRLIGPVAMRHRFQSGLSEQRDPAQNGTERTPIKYREDVSARTGHDHSMGITMLPCQMLLVQGITKVRYDAVWYGIYRQISQTFPTRSHTIHLQSFLRFSLLNSYTREEEPLHGSWLGHATMFVQANPRLMPVSPSPCRLSGGIMKYLNLLQSLMPWEFMPNLSYHVVLLNLEGAKTAFTPLRQRLLFKDCIIVVCWQTLNPTEEMRLAQTERIIKYLRLAALAHLSTVNQTSWTSALSGRKSYPFVEIPWLDESAAGVVRAVDVRAGLCAESFDDISQDRRHRLTRQLL